MFQGKKLNVHIHEHDSIIGINHSFKCFFIINKCFIKINVVLNIEKFYQKIYLMVLNFVQFLYV